MKLISLNKAMPVISKYNSCFISSCARMIKLQVALLTQRTLTKFQNFLNTVTVMEHSFKKTLLL
jgi:hypothetical protein